MKFFKTTQTTGYFINHYYCYAGLKSIINLIMSYKFVIFSVDARIS